MRRPRAPTISPGSPTTYIDIGDLDIFRDEDIAYARRLSDAGVPTELHLHPGCPHAFEGLASGADVSREQSAIGYAACAPCSHRKTTPVSAMYLLAIRLPANGIHPVTAPAADGDIHGVTRE